VLKAGSGVLSVLIAQWANLVFRPAITQTCCFREACARFVGGRRRWAPIKLPTGFPAVSCNDLGGGPGHSLDFGSR